VRTADDAEAAFAAAAALRAARVQRGQRGELRPGAHAALNAAVVRATAAEILERGGGQRGGGQEESEAAVSRLLASTLGRARQAGMPVGAKTFADAARGLLGAMRASSSSEEDSKSSIMPLLASAARGVLAASLACRVAPTPRLAAALLDAAAVAGGEEGATAARDLAAEFEANGVRLGPFAERALERARGGAAAAAAAPEEAAAAAAAAAAAEEEEEKKE